MKSLPTGSPRLREWANRIAEFLREQFPGIILKVDKGPNYDEHGPHRTAYHISFALPGAADDWGEVLERSADLCTDALLDTGRMIYLMPDPRLREQTEVKASA